MSAICNRPKAAFLFNSIPRSTLMIPLKASMLLVLVAVTGCDATPSEPVWGPMRLPVAEPLPPAAPATFKAPPTGELPPCSPQLPGFWVAAA